VFAKLDLCEFIYKKIFKKSHAIKWQETSENCKKHQKPSTTSLILVLKFDLKFRYLETKRKWLLRSLEKTNEGLGKSGKDTYS